MAAFLTSLGGSLGMNGPGGFMGGLGNLLGQSLTQPGAPLPSGNQGTTNVGQAQYTDPFKPVAGTATQAGAAPSTVQPAQTQTQPSAGNKAYDNWLLQNADPYGSNAINTGSASGYYISPSNRY